MWLHKRFFVIIMVSIIDFFNTQTAFPMQSQAQQIAALQAQLDGLREQLKTEVATATKRFDDYHVVANGAMRDVGRMDAVTAQAAGHAEKALTDTIEARTRIGEIEARIDQIGHAVANFAHDTEQVTEKSKADFSAHAEEERVNTVKLVEKTIEKTIEEVLREKSNPELERDKERIRADAYTKGVEKECESNQKIVRDNITKIAIAIVVTALCIYILKYGLPLLINYLTQPRIISETSRPGLFEWFKPKPTADIADLIFTPSLQKQLLDLLLRVQTAKKFNEALPNVLFYGDPGTGKTAFVKALAYESGLDYALTSGSEFAKITDLNHANNELRKLLNWAKRSKNGLIVFIDEAESLFANRKLATTSKSTQDFINTFLSLVSDQSQKKVLFIFATNHPFKLDDAITNRIGINVEFTLPEVAQREKILSMYLVKAAQENEDAVVDLHPDLIKLLPKYAESLKGFSPRAIKFVAEEMIINARRQEAMQLTSDIALAAIDQAKRSLQQTSLWEKERNEWAGGLNVIHA
jgi:Holliday junction resolvasome RuvABC ATP-dependent DNA helicase subunit